MTKRTKKEQKKREAIFKGPDGPTAKPKKVYKVTKFGKKHKPQLNGGK
jgi:hypothetical protein